MKRIMQIVTIALSGAVFLSGCGGEPPSTPAQSSEATVVQSAEIPQSEPEDDGPTQAELLAYFEALATGKPEAMSAAIDMAAPGSNAQAYAVYRTAAAQAMRDGGYPSSASTVAVIDGGFEECDLAPAEQDSCAAFTNMQHEGDKIADFDAGGTPLGGRLSLGNGESQSLGEAGEAKLIASYKSVSGSVVTVFEVTAKIDGFGMVTNYIAPDGRQTALTFVNGPTNLSNGALANYAFFFEGAEFGGAVSIEPLTDGYHNDTPVIFETR